MNIINYLVVNVFLLSVSAFVYILNTNIVMAYLVHLLKTLIIMAFVSHVQRDKDYITPRSNIYPPETIINFYGMIFIESCADQVILHGFSLPDTNVVYDLVTFIPKSFLLEVVYDFMHYWMHRLSHANKYLYQNFHKYHHSKINITYGDTYYHHPIDFIISNVIPWMIAMYIMKMSAFQCIVATTYKTIVEVSGHTGKNIHQGSFPQFPWLTSYLHIALYTHDHDAHHRYLNCNYAKRFALWDKIFGTHRTF